MSELSQELLEKQAQLKEMIENHNRIVFFGGAGVSTESGIPDFRSSQGIFTTSGRKNPEEVVSHSFFMQHPDEFYDFYKKSMIFLDAKPNKAHQKIAQLEQAGKVSGVVTQNIDGLHQAAGSKMVFELHGSVLRNNCMSCGKFFPVEYVMEASGVPKCDVCGSMVKPDVVLYEEALDSNVMDGAARTIMQADMMIIAGTSLVVYPAAGFVSCFGGDKLVIINMSPTSQDSNADLLIEGPVGQILDF